MHNKRNWNALQGLEMDKRDSPIVLLFGYNTFSLGKHSFKPFTNENEKMSLKGKQNIILKNSSLKEVGAAWAWRPARWYTRIISLNFRGNPGAWGDHTGMYPVRANFQVWW